MDVVDGSTTVPVKVGDALGALALICVCSALVTPATYPSSVCEADTAPVTLGNEALTVLLSRRM